MNASIIENLLGQIERKMVADPGRFEHLWRIKLEEDIYVNLLADERQQVDAAYQAMLDLWEGQTEAEIWDSYGCFADAELQQFVERERQNLLEPAAEPRIDYAALRQDRQHSAMMQPMLKRGAVRHVEYSGIGVKLLANFFDWQIIDVGDLVGTKSRIMKRVAAVNFLKKKGQLAQLALKLRQHAEDIYQATICWQAPPNARISIQAARELLLINERPITLLIVDGQKMYRPAGQAASCISSWRQLLMQLELIGF